MKSSHFVFVRRVRKTTISFVMFLRLSVGLSVRMEQLSSQITDIH
jgi:hypothetical protein